MTFLMWALCCVAHGSRCDGVAFDIKQSAALMIPFKSPPSRAQNLMVGERVMQGVKSQDGELEQKEQRYIIL